MASTETGTLIGARRPSINDLLMSWHLVEKEYGLGRSTFLRFLESSLIITDLLRENGFPTTEDISAAQDPRRHLTRLQDKLGIAHSAAAEAGLSFVLEKGITQQKAGSQEWEYRAAVTFLETILFGDKGYQRGTSRHTDSFLEIFSQYTMIMRAACVGHNVIPQSTSDWYEARTNTLIERTVPVPT